MLRSRGLALALFATTALAGNVLNELPNCWDKCSSFVSGTDCSWYDASCVCDLANDSNYLSATITCASQSCHSNWDPSDIDRFLSPIEFTCSLVGGISQNALNGAASAAAACSSASQTSAAPATTKSVAQHTTQAAPSPKTTSSTTSQLPQETTLEATITQSSSTAVVQQPISFGSTGVSSGTQSTSVLVSTIDIVPVPVSSASTITQGGIVQATGSLTSTPPFESASGTTSSSASSTETEPPGGGGTLFDSTGDAAGSNSVAGLVMAAYVVALAVIHAL